MTLLDKSFQLDSLSPPFELSVVVSPLLLTSMLMLTTVPPPTGAPPFRATPKRPEESRCNGMTASGPASPITPFANPPPLANLK
ncbi:hypothetical protein [Acinetobacter baumannii]|uniref:hypothetical protein n=1 Tax=Acinetobacter baumannii TaxID=470 RepID=UPI0018FF54B2|nr:hypothetical protein [Acinetobacter baumannii]MBJ9576045.1 hypothetical protein [Acinetobacter baumannii]